MPCIHCAEKMAIVDWELEEFKQFCFMIKPLKNYSNINLDGLLLIVLNLRKAHSQLKPGYSLEEVMRYRT